jgi:predicted metal-dependent peptidase
MDTERRLTKARANLVMAAPFYGSLALRLKFKADESVEESVVNGEYVRYNPKVIDKMTIEELTGHLAHLVLHPSMLHHTRRNGRDEKKWNRACDYVVDGIVRNSGFQLPCSPLVSFDFKDMSAEQIYTLLPDEESEDPPRGDKPGKHPGNGAVEDGPCVENPGEKANEEQQWKIAVAQAAHVAKQAGKLPADLERFVNELLEPEHPWREILQRFVSERAAIDPNWRRGNRRFVHQDLYLPAKDSDVIGEIVVVVDVSGSISSVELDAFAAEMGAIFEDVKPKKLHVIYCSAQIHKVDTFEPGDDFKIIPEGSGGTSFIPPFEWVEANDIKPKCLIYLTDGYGDFPEEEDAPFPTMWCITNEEVIPPFGEHLTLKI